MKKIKNVLLLVFSMVILLGVTGCGDKEALAADSFKTKMESAGYTVADATSQFNGAIEKVYVANNGNHQIEYYLAFSDDDAVSGYQANKQNFEEAKSGGTYKEVSSGNNAKYTQTSSGKYSVVSRIANTFIYANVDEAQKSAVDNILKDLGY